MKRLTIHCAVFILLVTSSFSQSCLPEGIELHTQEQIDNFQSNFPNCTKIEGGVVIGGSAWGSDIANLDGLSDLTSIGGNLSVSFVGLSNLTGLNNIISIGGLSVQYTHLTSLEGLDNVDSINGQLFIKYNDSLQSITSLSNVSAIEGYFNVVSNNNLMTLNGLENIESSSMTSLYIYDNALLTSCEVQSVCNYLANPIGIVSIFNNATGCNSIEEVEEACEVVSIDEVGKSVYLKVHPNPFITSTTIEYQINSPQAVSITIYNQFGKQVDVIEEKQQKGLNKVIWTPKNLADEVYYLRLQAGEQVATGKVVLMR